MPSSDVLTAEVTKDEVIEAVKLCIPAMVDHAASLPMEEVVGAVMLDGFTVKLYNEAKDRRSSFAVSPPQLKYLDSLVAVYHSHPDGTEQPSVDDEKGNSPIPLVILTETAVILYWYLEHVGYHRIWDFYLGSE